MTSFRKWALSWIVFLQSEPWVLRGFTYILTAILLFIWRVNNFACGVPEAAAGLRRNVIAMDLLSSELYSMQLADTPSVTIHDGRLYTSYYYGQELPLSPLGRICAKKIKTLINENNCRELGGELSPTFDCFYIAEDYVRCYVYDSGYCYLWFPDIQAELSYRREMEDDERMVLLTTRCPRVFIIKMSHPHYSV